MPAHDEYLIEVHSAAANFFDILQTQGKYQNQPRKSLLDHLCDGEHQTDSDQPSLG